MWLRELLRSGFLRHSGGEGSIQDDMMSSRGVSAPALWDLERDRECIRDRRSRDVSVAELAAQIRMTAACMTGSLLASLIFRLKNAPGDAVSVGR